MLFFEEKKMSLREVHEEVNQAREKALGLKLQRQRERLKQAYLKKQLEKLKAASSASTAGTT